VLDTAEVTACKACAGERAVLSTGALVGGNAPSHHTTSASAGSDTPCGGGNKDAWVGGQAPGEAQAGEPPVF
jgi:hypothetical protein